ncbi:MAG: hypothetical protein PHV18_14255 [Lachnospiraceae bacterium]|nr:hypothetical protein [Lachnospiraceae bacterium]
MAIRLIIDGNAVYEIDEECLERQKRKSGYQNRGRRPDASDAGGTVQEERKVPPPK